MVDASASAATATRNELHQHFGSAMPEDVMSEALSILRMYALTPSDLYFKWEAFVLSSGRSGSDASTGPAGKKRQQDTLAFNLENLRDLKKEIQAQSNSSNAAGAAAAVRRDLHGTPGGAGGPAVKKLGGRAALNGILDGLPSTPLAKRGKLGAGGGAGTPSTMTPLARNIGSMKPYSATPQTTRAGPSHLSRTADLPGSPSTFDSPSASGSSATRFEDRKNALEVVETLNGHLQGLVGAASEGSSSRIKMASNADPKAYNYRYMFEKISERAAVLDASINEAAAQLKEYYDLEDFGNPAHPSQDDHYAVGRICSEADGVRLTDTSIHFESSRLYGAGERVALRFDPDMVVRSSDDPSYSTGEGGVGMFPGMLCGLKGRNAGGGYFTVSEVLLMPPVDQPESAFEEVLNYQHNSAKYLSGQPMSVVVACGPFTVDDNLEYAPLQALLEEMSNIRPDLLILLGPFVDSSHPLLKVGDTDLTPQQLFQQEVSRKLSSFLDYSLNTTIVMIPSVRDMISHHIAYPQSPLEREALALHKRAKLLPNPATFSVNEVVFAVTSVDTLFSIKQNEFFKAAKDASSLALSSEPEGQSSQGSQTASKDAMARLCRHVLRQRSFYPLFPSPLAPPLEPLNLDVTHSNLLKFSQDTGADVFILPSMLKHFAKVVDSTVIVNPSALTRRNQPGTFAKLTIYPLDKAELEDGKNAMSTDEGESNETLHRVYERCRVDLVRI